MWEKHLISFCGYVPWSGLQKHRTSLVALQVQRGLRESGEQKSESVIIPPLEEFLWRLGQEQRKSPEKIGGTPQPGWNRPSSKPAGLGRTDQGKYTTHRTNQTSGKGIDYRNMKNTGTTRKNGGQITNQRGLMDLCWESSFGIGVRNRGACRYNHRSTTTRRNHLLASAQSAGNGMRTE